MSWFSAIVIVGIVAVMAGVAYAARRRSPIEEEDQTDPNYHTLRSDYQSGMGGGSLRTWKVPKDPQEYARFFVPKKKS